MDKAWYYRKSGQQYGPVSAHQLKQLADSGELRPTDFVRKDEVAGWNPAENMKGLFTVSDRSAPSIPQASLVNPSNPPVVSREPSFAGKNKSPLFWVAVFGGSGFVLLMLMCGGFIVVGIAMKAQKNSTGSYPATSKNVIKAWRQGDWNSPNAAHKSGVLTTFDDIPPPVEYALQNGHKVLVLRETRTYMADDAVRYAESLYVIHTNQKVLEIVSKSYVRGTDDHVNSWNSWNGDERLRYGEVSSLVKQSGYSTNNFVQWQGEIHTNRRITVSMQKHEEQSGLSTDTKTPFRIVKEETRHIKISGDKWTEVETRQGQTTMDRVSLPPHDHRDVFEGETSYVNLADIK